MFRISSLLSSGVVALCLLPTLVSSAPPTSAGDLVARMQTAIAAEQSTVISVHTRLAHVVQKKIDSFLFNFRNYDGHSEADQKNVAEWKAEFARKFKEILHEHLLVTRAVQTSLEGSNAVRFPLENWQGIIGGMEALQDRGHLWTWDEVSDDIRKDAEAFGVSTDSSALVQKNSGETSSDVSSNSSSTRSGGSPRGTEISSSQPMGLSSHLREDFWAVSGGITARSIFLCLMLQTLHRVSPVNNSRAKFDRPGLISNPEAFKMMRGAAHPGAVQELKAKGAEKDDSAFAVLVGAVKEVSLLAVFAVYWLARCGAR